MARAQQPAAKNIFISYSHKDERLRRELETHLSLLKREGLVEYWTDRKIGAGEEWKGAIDKNLARADIVLLLVSADFIHSDYCFDVEMKRALSRHRAGRTRVIPIILRPVDWHSAPFGKLQALPTDGKPVMSRRPRDAAWLDVAQGIRAVVRGTQLPTAPPAKARPGIRGRGKTAETPQSVPQPTQPAPRGATLARGRRGADAPEPSPVPRTTRSRPVSAVPAATLDEEALVTRAGALVPDGRTARHGEAQLCVVLVGGPAQRVLRPSELEDRVLADDLLKSALFGTAALFDRAERNAIDREGDALLIAQEHAALRIDETGAVRLLLPARGDDETWRTGIGALIEEDVRERLARALRFGGTVLNRVDRARRLTELAIVVALLGGGWLPWRTRAEQAANPGTATLGQGGDRIVVPTKPHRLTRAAFARETATLAADLTVLLRREVRR